MTHARVINTSDFLPFSQYLLNSAPSNLLSIGDFCETFKNTSPKKMHNVRKTFQTRLDTFKNFFTNNRENFRREISKNIIKHLVIFLRTHLG